MDKKIAGLVGAVSAFVALNGAQAATPLPSTHLGLQSYADLLQPIPNATALLAASDEALATTPADARTQVADHHHHHRYRRHHHHHHHHHHRYDRG